MVVRVPGAWITELLIPITADSRPLAIATDQLMTVSISRDIINQRHSWERRSWARGVHDFAETGAHLL